MLRERGWLREREWLRERGCAKHFSSRSLPRSTPCTRIACAGDGGDRGEGSVEIRLLPPNIKRTLKRSFSVVSTTRFAIKGNIDLCSFCQAFSTSSSCFQLFSFVFIGFFSRRIMQSKIRSYVFLCTAAKNADFRQHIVEDISTST